MAEKSLVEELANLPVDALPVPSAGDKSASCQGAIVSMLVSADRVIDELASAEEELLKAEKLIEKCLSVAAPNVHNPSLEKLIKARGDLRQVLAQVRGATSCAQAIHDSFNTDSGPG